MPEEPNNIPIRKKRTKNKKHFGYVYLFAFVFITALSGLSYLVKSYSPDVDVTIGNNDSLMLSESDMDVEIKSVDERLKWIQMEDEMPTVALRNSEKKSLKNTELKNIDVKQEDKKNKEMESKPKPPAPSITEIKAVKPDFRIAEIPQAKVIVPKPKPLFTKVYLGNYSTIEDAMSMQSKISENYSELNPFIKAINDYYVVQIGSFSDEEKAQELVGKLKYQGYSPKVTYEK